MVDPCTYLTNLTANTNAMLEKNHEKGEIDFKDDIRCSTEIHSQESQEVLGKLSKLLLRVDFDVYFLF